MYTIGTAGHVDHGKSTLVQALTGINPDRWEEERRREMTIDLGFAWMDLPSGRRISLVDVPGHERFIKNMLAGVGGLDAALLVVAANEGMRPQTVEHLHILDLLGIERALVVLSKRDLVDDEWLELMREELGGRLAGTLLAAAPIIPVSARSGAGLAELAAAIDGLLDQTPGRGGQRGAPRLPIDRVFSVGGFGTVVTGTLLDGPLRLGDEIEIQPAGLRARVRGLQTHQAKLELALPGTRVAANLSGVERSALRRGDVLGLPGAIEPTELLDVRLRVVAGGPLRHNAPLELFVGAAEVACHVALLDREELAPGAAGWVQLRLAAPLAAARGDRCIVRRASPGLTVGGGVVIDPHPARHRRFRPAVIAALETRERGTPAELLAQALGAEPPGEWRALLERAGLDQAAAAAAFAELRNNGQALIVQPGEESLQPATLVISGARWRALLAEIEAAAAAYHSRWRLRRGMGREELRSRLGLKPRPFAAALARAAAEDRLVIDEALARLPGHCPAPDAAQLRRADAVLAAFRAAPTTPPGRELLDTVDPELLAWLAESRQLTRVAADIWFAAEAYQAMRQWVEREVGGGGSVTLARFRDRWQTSRKYAQALLEHLDEQRVTRRVGDERVAWQG